VIEQELDLQGVLVEVGGGQGLRALSQRGPGDRQGVDRVRLAGSPFAAAAFAISFGGTRTTRSPEAIRKRSKAPETWRQSSIAQIRSSSRSRPQPSSWRKPGSLADAVNSPASWPVLANTAPQV